MFHLRIVQIKSCLVFLGCLCLTPVISQKLDTSSTLAVVPFKDATDKTDEGGTDYERIFAEQTLVAIQQSKRFNLIDRTDFSTILKEIELWEGEHKSDFKEKKMSDQALTWYGNRLKADFILTGTITTREAPIDMITGSYKASIGFTIKVINVRTGQVYVTKSFSENSGGLTKNYSSASEAIGAALTKIVKPVKEFVDEFFPIHAKYWSTDELDRKGEMREATIHSGSDRGFWLKQKLDIIVVHPKGLPPEDVGDAEIIAIQPDHSRVRITSVKKDRNLEAISNKSEVLYFRSKAN